MFLAKIVRISLIVFIFIVAYLPITINPRIFERTKEGLVSYIVADNVASAMSSQNDNVLLYQNRNVRF